MLLKPTFLLKDKQVERTVMGISIGGGNDLEHYRSCQK